MYVIEIKEGQLPWTPGPGAELVRVFNHYDMPLMGLIKQSEQHFVFECLEGQVGEWSVWAYVQVAGDGLGVLAAAPGVEDFGRGFDLLFATYRPYAVALSSEEHGIERWAYVDEPEKFDDPRQAAAALLHLQDEHPELLAG